MKEKLSILAGVGIICAVIVTLAFFIHSIGNLDTGKIFLIIIPFILVASAVFILWDRIKNIKRGLPAQDERSKQIGYKAAYYGFIAAIWAAVGAPLFAGIIFDIELKGNYVTAAVVLFSGLVFIVSYIILAYRGYR